MKIRIFGAALLLISALALSPAAKAENATVAAAFGVGGQVTSPSGFDLAKLEKLPATSQNVTYFAPSPTPARRTPDDLDRAGRGGDRCGGFRVRGE